MDTAIEKLQKAQEKAMAILPKVGGFPYLAEVLRQAGVTENVWRLPACQSLYVIEGEPVIVQGEPIITGMVSVPKFNKQTLISALRTDQAGTSTFPEFLKAAWEAGVIWYRVDFNARTVTYGGINDEIYVETYPAVMV